MTALPNIMRTLFYADDSIITFHITNNDEFTSFVSVEEDFELDPLWDIETVEFLEDGGGVRWAEFWT